MLLSHDLINSKAKCQQEKASWAEFSKCLYYDIISIPIPPQGPSHRPGHYNAKYYTKIKSSFQGAFITAVLELGRCMAVGLRSILQSTAVCISTFFLHRLKDRWDLYFHFSYCVYIHKCLRTKLYTYCTLKRWVENQMPISRLCRDEAGTLSLGS